MQAAWRFIRQWWWAFVAVASGIFLLAWRLMARGGGNDPFSTLPGEPPRPTFSERAEEKVERVRLEGEVEKAKVNTTAEASRAELERIEEVGKTDPRAARRQLSDFLTRSL